jgi:hypothetical protein
MIFVQSYKANYRSFPFGIILKHMTPIMGNYALNFLNFLALPTTKAMNDIVVFRFIIEL